MNFRFAQARRVSLAAGCLFALACTALAQQDDASAILRAVRVNPLGQPITLNARLRAGAGSTSLPFQIRVAQGVVHYVFTDPKLELTLQLGEDSSKLSENTGDKTSTVHPAKFGTVIPGTSVTYEDLALRFFYWPHPKLVGEQNIRTRDAYEIDIAAPPGDSKYGAVRIWLDKQSGALLRIEGYDNAGHLLKRFEVVSAQQIDGQWMLKQMRIEKLDPATGKVIDRTYLEVLGKA